MSERPTEALQRRIDGEGQGLMFRDGKPEPMRAVPISELREAVDTIAALTAEVGRLRGLLGEAGAEIRSPGDPDIRDSLLDEIDVALTPPADQADLTKCPECNGPADQGFSRDVPPVPYSCSKCAPEQPAPATKPWWCHRCRKALEWYEVTYEETHDERAGGCGSPVTGRIPATEDNQ